MGAARYQRILSLALLLPVLVLCGSGGGFSRFRCQLTGAILDDACCARDGSTQAAHGAQDGRLASLGESDCCTRETTSFARVVAAPPADAAPLGLAVAWITAAVSAVPALAPPGQPSGAASSERAGVPRPPLRIAKRSLLI